MFHIWHRIHDLRYSPPTAFQVCFVAGTTHLLSLASSRVSSKKHMDAAANVNECVKLLKHMAVSWPAAEQARILLEGLRTDYGLSGSASVPDSPRFHALQRVGGGQGLNMDGTSVGSSDVFPDSTISMPTE